MTKARRTALFLGLALVGTAAQATATRPAPLAETGRRDAVLEDRIARMELDRLVAKVDATMPERHARPVAAADRAARELAAYAY